jgi:long-chain acyl-CoA synthetase
MRIADSLALLTKRELGKVAWIERDASYLIVREWTWLDVRDHSVAAAQFLRDHGVRPQDPIASIAHNSIEWAILDFACSILNAIHCPIDIRQSPEVQARCVALLEAKGMFRQSSADLGDEERGEYVEFALGCNRNEFPIRCLRELTSTGATIESVQAEASPDDVANVLFTTGTSGSPKGVMLSHRNLITNAAAKLNAMPQFENDHRLNFLPFSHAYARTCELTTWLLSRSSMETVRGIDNALKYCSCCSPTLLNGVPLFYERLAVEWAKSDYSQESLHAIVGSRMRQLASGGARIDESLRVRFFNVGLPILQGYGLTEASPVVCSNRARSEGTSKTDTLHQGVGPAVDGVSLRVDDDTRLWVSGDGVMLGYWKDPVETQRRIRDGWLDTQDLAQWIDGTSIQILGRADDIFVLSNGIKLNPLVLEHAILQDHRIRDCLVIGNGLPYPLAVLLLNRSEVHVDESQGNEVDWTAVIRAGLKRFGHSAFAIRAFVSMESWRDDPRFVNFKGGLQRNVAEEHFREFAFRKNQESTLATNDHPSSFPIDILLQRCQWKFGRVSGPGGQNRNKVETSAIITYKPLGISAQASERRSQAENRDVAIQRLRCKLAVMVRARQDVLDEPIPSAIWLKYCRSSRIDVAASNPDWPTILAELLDVVQRMDGDLQAAATALKTTLSQIVKLLKKEPEAFRTVNALRSSRGLGTLK